MAIKHVFGGKLHTAAAAPATAGMASATKTVAVAPATAAAAPATAAMASAREPAAVAPSMAASAHATEMVAVASATAVVGLGRKSKNKGKLKSKRSVQQRAARCGGGGLLGRKKLLQPQLHRQFCRKFGGAKGVQGSPSPLCPRSCDGVGSQCAGVIVDSQCAEEKCLLGGSSTGSGR